MARVCVFCGSQPGSESSFSAVASAIGKSLGESGHTLVYGGGGTGQMGLIADAVMKEDAEVIGVIPKALAGKERIHAGVKDMRIVDDMHQRKAEMHSLADSYLILPGGLGTLEELFETLCWAQLEFHSSPIAILNHMGLYDRLLQLLEDMRIHGFLTADHTALLTVLSTVEECQLWLQDQKATQ